MINYAIIQLAGKQYKISEGDTLQINRLDVDADQDLVVEDVLLTASDAGTIIGTPLVEKAKVTLKVVDHYKGEKIRVAKYKSKSRYRRVNGHRQPLTTVTVTKIA